MSPVTSNSEHTWMTCPWNTDRTGRPSSSNSPYRRHRAAESLHELATDGALISHSDGHWGASIDGLLASQINSRHLHHGPRVAHVEGCSTRLIFAASLARGPLFWPG